MFYCLLHFIPISIPLLYLQQAFDSLMMLLFYIFLIYHCGSSQLAASKGENIFYIDIADTYITWLHSVYLSLSGE